MNRCRRTVGRVAPPASSACRLLASPCLRAGSIGLRGQSPERDPTWLRGGRSTFTITPPAENILAQAGAPYDTYGFDFNIEGSPATGDTFTVEFNTGGFDDNRNGLLLADLQNGELVRQNVEASSTADNHKTFNQAYSGIVTDIGVVTSQAQTNGAAFTALADQSEAWYESLSGVNLDEEAANLLRFQQSYAASAQVLSTARTIFDTLLSAAR